MSPRVLADPIRMEVFSNRLLSITEEMGSNLTRASFSTNIKEPRDCSVGLFDAAGRLIAQAAHIPLHLGSLLGAVDAVRREFPLDDMADGDAFFLPSKVSRVVLRAGVSMRIETPGGGGAGPPAEREAARRGEYARSGKVPGAGAA